MNKKLAALAASALWLGALVRTCRLPRTFALPLVLLCMSQAAMAQPTLPDTIAQRAAPCSACHGKEDRAASDGYYPRLAGKPAGYLYNQLVNFREGRRKYPLMVYMVDHLSDDYLHELADYFSGLHAPYPQQHPASATQSVLELGRSIVQSGDATRHVPACVACHGKTLTGVAPTIPGLIGLPYDYLSAQFGAWKTGARQAAEPDCMGRIASALTIDEVSAALAWLAAQPIPSDTAPATVAAEKLPIACGSFPQ